MKEGNFKLVEKEKLNASGSIWRLKFDVPKIEAEPGQFVNISVDGKYLRRPISISEYEDDILSLIIQKAGEGTRKLIDTRENERLNILTGLGNKFSIPKENYKTILIIGGGVGYAPLIGLMNKLSKTSSAKIITFLGFNSFIELPIWDIERMRKNGHKVLYSTMDGTTELQGNVVEVAKKFIIGNNLEPDYYYTCGPTPMMKAVSNTFDIEGEMSLESRMGCGFGACMGCSINTASGPKRICKEGPVFNAKEIKDFI